MNPIEWVLLKLFRHVDIKKVVDGQESVYLRRFYLVETEKVKVYLHIIKRSDEDPDPHDHPWDFTTIVLKNGYVDESYTITRKRLPDDRLGFLSVRKRRAEHIHMVKVQEGKPAWTLVFLGPYRRKWGFVKPQPEGWTDWRTYLNYWGPDPYDKVEKQELQ